MKITILILLWVARIAGTVALLLGLTVWIFQIDLVGFHMLSGVLVALSLLISSLIAGFTEKLRIWGLIGILYSLFVPYFGINQDGWLPDPSLHWLIKAAHLLVGIGAIALVQLICMRFQARRQPAPGEEAQAVRS